MKLFRMEHSDGTVSIRGTMSIPARILVSRRFRPIIKYLVKLEGGEMTSLLLRRFLELKYDVSVGPHTYGSLLEPGMCDRKTIIGAYCSIGKNVRRFGASHPLDSGSTHPYFYNPSLGLALPEDDVERTGLKIGPDVWIGSNVTILPGCSSIGFGAVIGAGSVVTKDVPDFAVVVGNPARIIRERYTDQKRAAIVSSKFWEKSPAEARVILKAL